MIPAEAGAGSAREWLQLILLVSHIVGMLALIGLSILLTRKDEH